MRDRRGIPYRLVGVAGAGVVLGHWLAYLIAVPSSQLRAEVLVESGHGYWALAVRAAVALGLMSVAGVVSGRLSRRLRGRPEVEDRVCPLALQLCALQVAGFTGLEVGERLAAGQPVAGMFFHHVYLVGLAVQALLALGGVLLLRWLGRAADRVCPALRASSFPRPRSLPLAPSAAQVHPLDLLSGAAGLRGPPSRA